MLWRGFERVDFVTVTSSAGADALVEQLGAQAIRARAHRLRVVAHGGEPVLYRVMVRRRDLTLAASLLQDGRLVCDDIPVMTSWTKHATRCIAGEDPEADPDATRLVCGECGYDMTSMSRAAPCPECGGRGPRAEVPVNPPKRNAGFWMLMVVMAILCGLPVLILLSMLL